MSDEKLTIGSVAPDFTLPAVSGEQITLSAFKGKQNVILFFMRSFTCMQCREFTRQLGAARADFAARNAQVFVIGPGDKDAAERTVKFLRIAPGMMLYDEDGKVYESFLIHRAFFSMIQQSAAFVLDQDMAVKHAVVTANMMNWLRSESFHLLLKTLEAMQSEIHAASA